jgi:signal transduction histidine kinase
MNGSPQPFGPRATTLFGFLVIGVVALRTLLFYQGQPQLAIALLLVGTHGLVYVLALLPARRSRWFGWLYFPLQTALVLALTNQRPFLDASSILYIPLFLQALRAFSRPAAVAWMVVFAALLSATLVLGMGWTAGLSLGLLILAGSAFLVSYDLLIVRRQADQAESEALLAEIQQAHKRLQDQAAQAEVLATARERNRLARELHDSVGQIVFGITFTSQSARLLLERDPARVPEQLDRLEALTASALGQLRSLIAQLRPPATP